MSRDLTNALENCSMVYMDLTKMAKSILEPLTEEANNLIAGIKGNINNMSNDMLRNSILQLSLTSYSFSEVKELSSLRVSCAEILKKEKYAMSFNEADGSVANRENSAVLNSSEEAVVEALYGLVASMLKTKLDEIHRVVDTMKTVIMSRMSEARLSAISDVGQEQ